MSFSFRNKNIDSMKIKKFYYYSPEKLKLVPLNNFLQKAIILVVCIIILSVSITGIISKSLNSNNSDQILSSQNKILTDQFKREIASLKSKYRKLSDSFIELKSKGNDLRLAVNLEPIENENNTFGIGGSELFSSEINSRMQNKDLLSDIYQQINDLEINLKIEQKNYLDINDKFVENKTLFNHIPAISPVKSAMGDRFGMRFHPILKRRRMHHGLDFLSNTGDSVFAPGDGTVTYIGKRGGYGKVIRINHNFGYETLYAHLSKYKVKKGQKIKRGDLIAISGNSGSLSTGPHLHYEVRHNGISLNPRNFLFEETRLFGNSNNYLASK